MAKSTLADRFHARYDVAANGCWIWRPPIARNGYGVLSGHDGVRPMAAHRVAYELLVGPISEGMEIDHLCRTPVCVNPAHLEPVTHAENMRRYHQWRRAAGGYQFPFTHCLRGHEYTAENTYIPPSRPRYYQCRQCIRDAARRYKERRKKAA